MSLKIRLISCISAFILVLSMLFIGVYAAQSVELNVGGSVSFTASSVYADITGSYVGTMEHPSTAKELTPIHITADTTDGAASMPNDWTSMPLNFDESGSPITVTITIQNLASDRAIAVSLTDNTNITGVNVARTYNSSSFSGITSSQTINGGGTGTFTFTLTLTSQNNDISGDFDVDLDLTNIEQPVITGHTVNIEYKRHGIYITNYVTDMSSYITFRINGNTNEKVLADQSNKTITLNNVETLEFYSPNPGEKGSNFSSCLVVSGDINAVISEDNDVNFFEIDQDIDIKVEFIWQYAVIGEDSYDAYIDEEGWAIIRGLPGFSSFNHILYFPANLEAIGSLGRVDLDPEIHFAYSGICVGFDDVKMADSELYNWQIDMDNDNLQILDVAWANFIPDISMFDNLREVHIGRTILQDAYDNETSEFLSKLQSICENYAANGKADEFNLYVPMMIADPDLGAFYSNDLIDFDIESLLADYGFVLNGEIELSEEEYYYNLDYVEFVEEYGWPINYFYHFKYQG